MAKTFSCLIAAANQKPGWRSRRSAALPSTLTSPAPLTNEQIDQVAGGTGAAGYWTGYWTWNATAWKWTWTPIFVNTNGGNVPA